MDATHGVGAAVVVVAAGPDVVVVVAAGGATVVVVVSSLSLPHAAATIASAISEGKKQREIEQASKKAEKQKRDEGKASS